MTTKLSPFRLMSLIAAGLCVGTRRDEPVSDEPRPTPRDVPPFGLAPRVRVPVRLNPEAGWFVCACGAKANPHDKRWRDLPYKTLLLAMGWEDRDGVMVCPACRKEGGA